jgi:hypothetical protein
MTALKDPVEHQDDLRILASLAEIPKHNPNRSETTDGLDNPSCTNGDRAFLAAQALDCFQEACGMVDDVETAAADLICNLLHLIHANDRDPLPTLRNGIDAFLCEVGHLSPRYEGR